MRTTTLSMANRDSSDCADDDVINDLKGHDDFKRAFGVSTVQRATHWGFNRALRAVERAEGRGVLRRTEAKILFVFIE